MNLVFMDSRRGEPLIPTVLTHYPCSKNLITTIAQPLIYHDVFLGRACFKSTWFSYSRLDFMPVFLNLLQLFSRVDIGS